MLAVSIYNDTINKSFLSWRARDRDQLKLGQNYFKLKIAEN